MSVTSIRAILAAGFLTAAGAAAGLIIWLPLAGSGDADSAPTSGGVTRVIRGNADGGIDDVTDVSEVSPAQAVALADGYVTRQEYEAAVWAAFECIQDAGYEPLGQPQWNAGGTGLVYQFISQGDGKQSEVMLGCEEQHLVLVAFSWARQRAPSEEQLAAGDAAMRDCLVAGGMPEQAVRSAGRFQEFEGLDDGGLYGRCIREVSEEFGLGWSGN